MNGYIKLFRQLIDWEWYHDKNTKILWIHILLKANYTLKKFEGRLIYAGQLVTSIRALREETGLTEREVRTALDHLKTTHEIKVETTNKFSVITIEKWRFFQVDECVNDTLNSNPFDKQPSTTKEI